MNLYIQSFILLLLAAGGALAQPAQTGAPTNADGPTVGSSSNAAGHEQAADDTNEIIANSGALITTSSDTNLQGTGTAIAPAQTAPGQGSRTNDSSAWRRNRQYSRSSREAAAGSFRSAEPVANPGLGSRAAGARPDFSNFRLIADRNIFDPNRRGSRPSGSRERAVAVESFSLVGVMSYEKGTFAFFDGSSSAYRKALKPDDTIAGYRLAEIDANSVKLVQGTNDVELRVGMQVRREEQGPWIVSALPQTYTASTTSSAPASAGTAQPDSSPSGVESDVLRKLRERREKE